MTEEKEDEERRKKQELEFTISFVPQKFFTLIFNLLMNSANSNSYFFLLSFIFHLWSHFFKLCFQHVTHVTNVIHRHGHVQVWAGVGECAWVNKCLHGFARVCMGMFGYVWLCVDMHGCVQDELSEYLLETRFLTSANYNMHPL